PTERSTLSRSQPRTLSTFSVVADARSSATGKVWDADPASPGATSATTSVASANATIFISEPPGPEGRLTLPALHPAAGRPPWRPAPTPTGGPRRQPRRPRAPAVG